MKLIQTVKELKAQLEKQKEQSLPKDETTPKGDENTD